MLALCGCGLNIDVAMFVYTVLYVVCCPLGGCVSALFGRCTPLLYVVAIAQSKVSAFLSVELHLIIYRRRVLCRAIYYILYSSPAFIRKNRFTEMYAQMAVMKMPKSSTAQAVMAKTCQVMMLSIFSW